MLIVRHADRLSRLVDHVVATMAQPLADPMQAEWIAVPARGTQVWLTEQLSRRVGTSPGRSDGVVANVTFGFPGTLGSTLLTQTQPRDTDPWALDQSVFAIMALLQDGAGDPRLGPMGEPVRHGTHYRRARRVADLFDRYNVRRPMMIQQWAAGNRVDPLGRPLGPRAWQAELWTRLHERIGEPSAAERLPGLLRDLRSGALDLDLPPRVTLFGLSVIPERLLQLLGAMAQHRDVHVLMLQPSPGLAGAVRSIPMGHTLPPRAEDPSVGASEHPLVSSWGRPMREAAVMLSIAEFDSAPVPVPESEEEPVAITETLLHELQDQIRANRAPAHDFVLAKDDASLTVHSCHGPARQVEVLHDLLLHALEDNPTWTPDDVAVLVTDVETYAPIIDAVFRSAPGRTARAASLPYRITDQSLQATNPYATAAISVLDLLRGDRFEASRVADVLALVPVRHRFGFDDEDVRTITEWMEATNVRWGLNAETRRTWGIDSNDGDEVAPPNSWRSTIDQMLLGAAVADSPFTLTLGSVPTVPVEGSRTVLAGHVAEIIGHLELASERYAQARPVAEWCGAVRDLLAELLSLPQAEEWQYQQFNQVLARVSASAADQPHLAVEFPDFADLVAEHLAARSRRASFQPGTITITSLAALRSVPHRMICILGLDDNAFGASVVDGDDLSQIPQRVGDPDARNDSRQVLLEALLAATDQLVITRNGHDIVRNHAIPEAVPVAELWDVIGATLAGAGNGREQLEFRHSRHGFDPENFVADDDPDALSITSARTRLPFHPFGHDPLLLRGAEHRVRRGPVTTRPALVQLDAPIVRAPVPAIASSALHRLMRSPTQFFMQSGLQVRIPYREDPFVDRLPVEADALEGWRQANTLMAARSAGIDDVVWLASQQTRGAVAQGQLATANLEKIDAAVQSFVDDVELCGGWEERETSPFAFALDGQVVTGSVDGVRRSDSQITRFEYKRPKAHHRLSLWLDLLLMTMAEPDVMWSAHLVTREASSGKSLFPRVTRMWVRGHDGPERHRSARTGMRHILDLHARALAEPLPLMPATSWVARAQTSMDKVAQTKVADAWAEDIKDEYIRLAFGNRSWRDMQAEPPRADEPAPSEPARCRSESWGRWLWDVVDESCRVVEGHPPAAGAEEPS